jgi:hypothetical protein
MQYLVIIFFLITPVFANAQDTAISRKFEEKTIFLYGGKYMLDGQRLPKSSVIMLLNKYPESRAEYTISKKWITGARVLNAASLVLYVAAFSQLDSRNYQKFKTYTIASLVTMYISMPISRQGKRHFDKSLWLYNKNAMAY